MKDTATLEDFNRQDRMNGSFRSMCLCTVIRALFTELSLKLQQHSHVSIWRVWDKTRSKGIPLPMSLLQRNTRTVYTMYTIHENLNVYLYAAKSSMIHERRNQMRANKCSIYHATVNRVTLHTYIICIHRALWVRCDFVRIIFFFFSLDSKVSFWD